MKTLSDYTIYCTESQTRKALELGAPIKRVIFTTNDAYKYTTINKGIYIIPTAEQMIGWLVDQDSIINIEVKTVNHNVWEYKVYGRFIPFKTSDYGYKSRKEATLAAIDAALEYLSDNKKNG